MFGKVASCKTTTTLYHFFIPQLGKYSCFFLSPQGGIVHMTWKTLVFLNDSSWKWTVVACAKYRSETGKGWPAAGCSKWKLYVVRAALWSGCIASCLIGKQRSAFRGESWTVPFCSSFLCFVLNSSRCTCSLTSCKITNVLLILSFLYKWRKTSIFEDWISLIYVVQGASPTDIFTVLSCVISLFLFCAIPAQVEHRLSAEGLSEELPQRHSHKHSLESLAHL